MKSLNNFNQGQKPLVKALHVSALDLKIGTKVWTTLAAIICAVVLPQVLHGIGLATGTGTLLGHALLPMQLPVMLIGFIAGPVSGILAGIISPIVSLLTTGMPSLTRLPFMMAELACYGCVAGFLVKTKMFLPLQIVIVQLSGHLLLLLVNFFIALASHLPLDFALITYQLHSLYIGLPGLIIQWVLIPIVLVSLNKAVSKIADNKR